VSVLDAPPVERHDPPVFTPEQLSRLSRWRFASRLARREVRRRPGRTALVTLLVAVPVFGMTAASVVGRTQDLSPDQQYQRQFGASDIHIQVNPGGTEFTDPVLTQLFPKGSTWERYLDGYGNVRNATQGRGVEFTDYDLASPTFRGNIEISVGRAPQAADEIALDPATAAGFGVGVGDQLPLVAPAGNWKVTGIVRKVDAFRDNLLVFGQFDHDRVALTFRQMGIYIHLPAGASISRQSITTLTGSAGVAVDVRPSVAALSSGSFLVKAPLSAENLAWGWVAGALALAVVGIIVASAFATSARRQLATIGQLSANGANQRLLRRTLALQGAWSGAIGSAVGIGGGLVALIGLHGLVDRIVARHLGSYRIAVADLAVIFATGVGAATFAALVPARTAARVPVTAALAGRRPLHRVPRRLVPIGVGLFAAGLFMLAVAATGSTSNSGGHIFAVVAVVGGVGVLAGMCCLTPLTIDVVGRVGTHLSASLRLSARSLSRTRTRSAAVVTAIAAAASLATGGSTYVTSRQAESARNDARTIQPYAPNAVIITNQGVPQSAPEIAGFVDQPTYLPLPVPTDVVNQVTSLVAGTTHIRRVALWNPAPEPVDQVDQVDPVDTDGTPINNVGSMVIADPFVLDLLGMSPPDRDRLREVGATVILQPGQQPTPPGATATHELDIEGVGKRKYTVFGLSQPLRSYAGIFGTLITPQAAQQLGLQIVDEAVVVVSPTNLTEHQMTRLAAIAGAVGDFQAFDRPNSTPAVAQALPRIGIIVPAKKAKSSAPAIRLGIAAAALLFTLLVVAIGLGLSAAENRDERDILLAIGARPRTIRRTSAQKAGYLTLVGGILAVPTGLLPIAVVQRSLGTVDTPAPPFAPDWTIVGIVVVAVPLAAAGVTWLCAGIAQRVRHLAMSTSNRD
jgi:putative ABC transport system permease protein